MIFHLKGETINKVPKQRTSFHRNLAPRGEVNYRLWSRSRSFFPPRTCIPMHLSTIMQYDILSRTKQREPSKSLSIPRSSDRAMKCIRVFPFHSRHLSVIIIPLSMLLSTPFRRGGARIRGKSSGHGNSRIRFFHFRHRLATSNGRGTLFH